MSRRVVTIALVAVLATLLAAAGAALAFPAYAPEVGTATGPSTQDAAHTSTYALVWEDDAAGDWDVVVGLTDPDDVVSHPNAAVPAPAGNQRHPVVGGTLVVYGDDRGGVLDGMLVVYEDDRGGDWDLYASKWQGVLGTVGAPDERTVVTGPGDQTDADISGDTVVYVDDARGNPDIAVHHLDTGQTAYVTTNGAAQADPSVDGKWVVWTDRRNGNWDIYAYDLNRGVLKRLTTNKASQTAPEVGQNKVVYQDRRNGNWDVYQYNLANGKELRLTTGASDQTEPGIDPHPWTARPGNVVYADDRRDAGDIYLRDGATGIVKRICTAAGAQTGPSIDAEHIAWTDARAGQPDVYSGTLAYPEMSAKPRSATPPFNAYGRVIGSVRSPSGSVVSTHVYAVRAGTTYKARVTGVDGATSGSYSVVVGRLQRKATVRVWYGGSATSLPIKGGIFVIKPKAGLSRPECRWQKPPYASQGYTMWAHDEMIVSGTLRPHHSAGSRAVTLMIFRKHPIWGWQLEKRVRVAVRGSGPTSTYRIRMHIDDRYPNVHRVQAVHADADHTETLSAFSRDFHM